MSGPTGARPLDGVQVLDLSRALAGPFCSQLLGDLGAHVVKVERPGAGDDMRHWTPRHEGLSAYFMIANGNKRSVALDLKATGSREVLARLVERSDIVVENFPPDVARRLGVDQPSLQAMRADVIVCSIHGFEAPEESRPAYDAAIQAMAGIMSVTGWPDSGPTRVGVAFVDFATGLYAALGALAALRARDLGDPSPGHVEVALMSTATALMSLQILAHLLSGYEFPRLGAAHPTTAPSDVYETATGHLLVVAGNQRQWAALTAALDRPEWADDARFATNAARVARRDELRVLVAEVLRGRTTEDWASRLRDHGVPYAPVRTVAEVAEDPAVQQAMVHEVDHPQLGPLRLVGSPLRSDGRRPDPRSAPPLLGEHTDDILHELGFSATDIAALRKREVIA